MTTENTEGLPASSGGPVAPTPPLAPAGVPVPGMGNVPGVAVSGAVAPGVAVPGAAGPGAPVAGVPATFVPATLDPEAPGPATPGPATQSSASQDPATPQQPAPAQSTTLETPAEGVDGVNHCPKCGASDVVLITATAQLRCRYCRHEWTTQSLDEAMGLSTGIGELKGTVRSTAAADIEDTDAIVTLKCTGCGAEVVINTDQNLKARCHWCKSVLSLNNRIANGAVPDGILPFTITKEQAMKSILNFVLERRTYASPVFQRTFVPANIMGVYLPYMTVDGNVDAELEGVGEILISSRRVNDHATEYTAASFNIVADISLAVDDLIVETSSSKVNIHSEISTNNVINALLPFDVKNIVRFDANYLGDEFTSERRDMDIDEAEMFAANHFLTIARGATNPSLRKYTRGVRWDKERLRIEGSRWTAVLLPVWLYGFVEVRKGRQITHFIAVNGRNGFTMGSVPINWGKVHAVAWGTAIGISAVAWPLAIALAIADFAS